MNGVRAVVVVTWKSMKRGKLNERLIVSIIALEAHAERTTGKIWHLMGFEVAAQVAQPSRPSSLDYASTLRSTSHVINCTRLDLKGQEYARKPI
jgi:hypothetical protein